METLAFIAPYVAAGGTALQAIGQIQSGNAAAKAANYQAAEMRKNAGQERATAQRAAAEEHRRERIIQSNLIARSAGSGAGASDPTVIDLSGDIAEEGLYRANTALFTGEERARSLETGARLQQYEGKQKKRAGYYGAASTALSFGNSNAGQTLYDRYG